MYIQQDNPMVIGYCGIWYRYSYGIDIHILVVMTHFIYTRCHNILHLEQYLNVKKWQLSTATTFEILQILLLIKLNLKHVSSWTFTPKYLIWALHFRKLQSMLWYTIIHYKIVIFIYNNLHICVNKPDHTSDQTMTDKLQHYKIKTSLEMH